VPPADRIADISFVHVQRPVKALSITVIIVMREYFGLSVDEDAFLEDRRLSGAVEMPVMS